MPKSEAVDPHQLLREKEEELKQLKENLAVAEKKLIEQERLATLGNLIAGIAHEIKNPVNFINSSIDALKYDLNELFEINSHLLIKKELNDTVESDNGLRSMDKRLANIRDLESEIQVLMKSIESGTKRTVDLVKNLNGFMHKDGAEVTPYDIRDGIESTIMILRHEWKNRIEIKRQYDDIPPVHCFPSQINQVFMNLIVNAIHAIADKGIIMITATFQQKTNRVQVEVADNGCGIEPDIINKIFQAFFTTKDKGTGTGLGLAISRELVEKHNGTLTVTSTPGKGSVFTVSLPVHEVGLNRPDSLPA